MKKVLHFFLLGVAAFLLISMIVEPQLHRRIHNGPTPALSELATSKSLLDNFQLDCGRFPTTEEGLSALLHPPVGLEKKWKGPYGSKPIVLDPFGTPYVYVSSSKNTFQLTSYGADGKPGGDGDDADLVVSE